MVNSWSVNTFFIITYIPNVSPKGGTASGGWELSLSGSKHSNFCHNIQQQTSFSPQHLTTSIIFTTTHDTNNNQENGSPGKRKRLHSHLRNCFQQIFFPNIWPPWPHHGNFFKSNILRNSHDLTLFFISNIVIIYFHTLIYLGAPFIWYIAFQKVRVGRFYKIQI